MKNILQKSLYLSIIVVASASAVVLAAEPNLIPNADLEIDGGTGLPQDWHKSAFGTNTREFTYPVEGPAGESDKAAKVEITSFTSGEAKWYFDDLGSMLGIPVEDLAVYTFTDSYNSNVESAIWAQFTLNDNTSSFARIGTLEPTGGVWQTASREFVVPLNAVAMTIFHSLNKVGELSTDNYSLTLKTPASQNIFEDGLVTLTFDDGWASQLDNAMQILQVAEMRGTFYIISNAMLNADPSQTPEYMSATEILNLQSAGNEIGGHTLDHCDLVRLNDDPNSAMTGACASNLSSPSSASMQIAGRDTLINTGANPVDSFAYPYGHYNDSIKNLLDSAGFKNARSIEAGYNTKNTDNFALKTQLIDSTLESNPNALSIVQSWIDTAKQNKLWLILTLHQVESQEAFDLQHEEEAVTAGFFQSVIDVVKNSGVTVKTMQEVLDGDGGSSSPGGSELTVPTPIPTPTPTPTPDATPSPTPTPTPTEGSSSATPDTTPAGSSTPTQSPPANGPVDFGIVNTSGQVLGVNSMAIGTGGSTCSIYLPENLSYGNRGDEVVKLQEFLNETELADLPVTGNFLNMTFEAVRKFQIKYKDSILTPLGLSSPTGNAFIMTRTIINALNCK